jgi:CHAT domain-containing protein
MRARSLRIACLLASVAEVVFLTTAAWAGPRVTDAHQEAQQIKWVTREQPVQRTLQGGERHRFQINLRKNQFVVISVQQLGIDVITSLVRQNGTTLIEIDGPDGVPTVEQLPWVAQQSGRYFLDVRSRNANARPGRYELRVVVERQATAQDVALVAAAVDYAQALSVAAPGTAEADRTLIAKLENAAAVLHDAGDYAREAHVCRALAEAHRRSGEYDKAFEWYEREARLRHEAGDQYGEGLVLNNIGFTYSRQGNSKKALEYFERALPLHRAAGNRRGEANTLNNLAFEHRDSDPLKTIELSQHARAIFKELEDAREEANTIIETARVYLRLKPVPGGDDYRAKALELLEEARPLLDAVGDRRGVANLLMRIGFVHHSPSQDLKKMLDPSERTRNLAKARDAFERARTLFRDTGDGVREAEALTAIGQVSVDSSQHRRAVEAWRDALVLRRGASDTRNEADLLSKLGGAYEVLDQNAESLTSYQQEQPLRRTLNDELGWAIARAAEGRLQVRLRDAETSVILLGEALAVFQRKRQRDDEAATHRYRGLAYLLLKQETNAVESFNQDFQLLRDSNRQYFVRVREIGAQRAIADPEFFEKQDKVYAAPALTSLEMVWDWLGFGGDRWDRPFAATARRVFLDTGHLQGSDALNYGTILALQTELAIANYHLRAALKQDDQLLEALSKNFENRPPESRNDRARTLQSQGDRLARRDSREALRSYQDALAIRREIADRQGISETLMAIGRVAFELNDNRKALSSYNEAREIRRADGDRAKEAASLTAIGNIHNWTGDRRTALTVYEQALALSRAAGDKNGEAATLFHMGETSFQLGEKQRALDYLSAVLPLTRTEQHPDGDARALALMGVVHASLDDTQRSREYFRKSVEEFKRELARGLLSYNLREKSARHNDLGDVYYRLGETAQALHTFRRGLALQKEFGSRSDQAYALDRIGRIQLASNDPTEQRLAQASFEQALELRRIDGNAGRQAEALHNLGNTHRVLGDHRQALASYHQALAIRHRLHDVEGEAETLDELMRLWKSLDQPRVAIYYGKQAVNALQQIRSNIRGLDKDLQQSYLTSRSGTYRELADLLIGASRLPEAQLVLDLLKKDEYLEFIRRSGVEDVAGTATLNSREAEQQKRFQQIQDRVVAAGERLAMLSAKPTLTTDERRDMTRLEKEVETANEAFDRYLAALPEQFTVTAKGESVAESLGQARALAETLRELGDHTVALYTVVTEKQYHIILFTADAPPVARSFPIPVADLNRKVQQFRTVLRNPYRNPIPLAQELYRIVVGPVAQDLVQAKAKTLMWSLDGALRYVPISALHDGERYLVERHPIAVFTPASNSRLEKSPPKEWRGLGLGVSKGTAPLPYVTEELRTIIRDTAEPDSKGGVVTGKILLDDMFTKDAMKEALRRSGDYSLVHIASHFRFKPGNEFDSYLLLGGTENDEDRNRHLTLAEIKSGTNLFRGVELLTLSACNTAVGTGEGAEVENFAVLAQLKGARAVVATLWPVDDRSTMSLMQTFYRTRNANPTLPKIEGLRKAQLELLQGSTAAGQTNDATRAVTPDDPELDKYAPPFQRDPKAPFAHPYYWAPFILIGNWR